MLHFAAAKRQENCGELDAFALIKWDAHNVVNKIPVFSATVNGADMS